MLYQLTLAPTARQQGAQHGAFLLDGRICKHHKHDSHNDHEQKQQHRPHCLVALHVVERIANALVVVGVDKAGEQCVVIGEDVHHLLFHVRPLLAREALVVKDKGVVVYLALASKALVAHRVHDGHRKGERVEHKAVVVLEERLVVGKRNDTANRKLRVFESHDVADHEPMVFAKDTVERDLARRGGGTALGVRGQVDVGARGIDATRYAIRLVAAFECGAHLFVEVRVQRHAQLADRGQRLLLGLEVARKATVLYAVGLLHVAYDRLDAACRQQKTAGKRYGKCHHQKDANVLAQIGHKLAPMSFEEWVAHATTPGLRRATRRG